MTNGRRRAYFYRFVRQPDYSKGHPYFGPRSTHGIELPYVFGTLDESAANWSSGDQELASIIQQYWTNFAKTGDPDGTGLPRWPMFDSEQGKVMNLDQPVRAAPLADYARLKRLDRVYATTRFVNRNLYSVLATAFIMLFLVLTMLVRFLVRLKRRSSANEVSAD